MRSRGSESVPHPLSFFATGQVRGIDAIDRLLNRWNCGRGLICLCQIISLYHVPTLDTDVYRTSIIKWMQYCICIFVYVQYMNIRDVKCILIVILGMFLTVINHLYSLIQKKYVYYICMQEKGIVSD